MGKFMTKMASVLAVASMTVLPMTPAMARNHQYDRGYGYNNGQYNNGRYYSNGYDRRYNNNYRNRYYRGERCDKGTGGTIIGAIAGGLLGHEVVGRRGDKTAGTIIGAGVGALAGRAIDRSDGRRC